MAWLLTAERGRFRHVVLPPGIDGAGLLQLGASQLSAAFAGQGRAGRGKGEGGQWTLAAAALFFFL